jgi:hypothetical protein
MKHTFNIYSCLLIVALCFVFQACEKDEDSKDAPRIFRPTSLAASVTDVTVTLTWNAIPGAESYTVEISRGDSLEFTNIIDRYVVTETTYQLGDLAGGTIYSARVRANSSDMNHDSKYAQVTFRVAAENIFKNYTSYMLGIGEVQLNWAPEKTVTKVILNAGSGDVDYPVTPAEVSAGSKKISGLANGIYRVTIFNADINRGTTDVTIKGDTFVADGEDLAAALTAAVDGDIIILESESVFTLDKYALTAGKTISIVGANSSQRSILYNSSSAELFTLADNAHLNLENINFNGQYDNSAATYVINHTSAVDFGTISFENCHIQNYGRSVVRVNHASAKIEHVTINNCILNNMGRDGNYCIVQANATGSRINNITVTNSTIYDLYGCVFYNNAGQPFNSLVIENCTFYNVFNTQNQGFFRANPAAGVPATSSIQGVIVGKLKLNTGVVRLYDPGAASSAPTVSTNNYRTSGNEETGDCWLNVDYAMEIPEYGKTSADLFFDPENADFSFKDKGFAGLTTSGDPRWR